MKDVDILAAACELEVVRPVHAPKLDNSHPIAIDLVAILDPLEDTGTNEVSRHQARNIWLGRSLPRAFEGARILAYRRTRPLHLDKGSEVEIEAFATRLLSLLSRYRQQTNTVRFLRCDQ